MPAATVAEQASQPASLAAGQLDVSSGAGDDSGHTCARVIGGGLRCWGFGGGGRLGYANTSTIGDDETPGAVGPVDLGSGRTAEAISAGGFHSCALLDDAGVRCWGFGGDGRLGYANRNDVGDDETPGSAGPVELGRRAEAISAGGGHSCALLDDGRVRCWGFGDDGRLGYGDDENIGDDEAPASVGPVDLGSDSTGTAITATAISAGQDHTCAVLDGGRVRCWGLGSSGALGYGDTNTIGEDEAPGAVGPVDLGEGRTAKAISAGSSHTCALLDDGGVRCWGSGGNGRLGYGNTITIGDNEKPGTVGPVELGATATAITAGDNHTCALLDGGSVRCWGLGGDGRLGYGNRKNVGDDEAPGSVGPVDLGSGRTAVAISAGGSHTCALLDDASTRCWGNAATGRLGYCDADDIGDDESAGAAGPVNVTGASDCPAAAPPPVPDAGGTAPARAPTPDAGPRPQTGDSLAERRRRARYRRAFAAQARRRRKLRDCYASVLRHARSEQRDVRDRDSARGRLRARRHLKRHHSRGRRTCRRRHGRTPGRVTRLSARAVSPSKVVLSFRAPGTAGRRPPAAREYVVNQSRVRLRGRRRYRGPTLCRGRCRFDVTLVGAKLKLTVTNLRPRTTYYYSIVARDNVSRRRGPRSPAARARTRP